MTVEQLDRLEYEGEDVIMDEIKGTREHSVTARRADRKTPICVPNGDFSYVTTQSSTINCAGILFIMLWLGVQ